MMPKSMISFSEAQKIVMEYAVPLASEKLPLEQCVGAVLKEDLKADRDLPPFNRVAMDGIGICYAAFAGGQRRFKVEDIAPAGVAQKTLQNENNCLEVMTGSVLPQGMDTVIRYEDLTIQDGYAEVADVEIREKQNIHFRGIDQKQGNLIVPQGRLISPAEINIAATVGKAYLEIAKLPKTVIISTGNELVDIDQTPEPHQIRKSNHYCIHSLLSRWGVATDFLHLPDEKEQMEKDIARVLSEYDAIILTGGVSKGKFDYVPEVLEHLGVEKIFHKVKQRPGKPFWFGTRDNKRVFALPGNPVSSMVCTCLYFRPWLEKSAGITRPQVYAVLENEIRFGKSLTYHLEAKVSYASDGRLCATAMPGNGSGDFVNLVNTDGFLVLPEEQDIFCPGEAFPFIFYR